MPLAFTAVISSTARVYAEFPTSGFELIDSAAEIEEETLPTYRPEKFYPIHLGETLNGRYQILAKLGYGVTSTVWLGRDLVDSKFVALKVYVTGQEERNHELSVYRRINEVDTNHPGRRCIRKLYDHFSIKGPNGQHVCLVHEPLGMTANDVLSWRPGKVMNLGSMKACIRQLLVALDFLHSVCGIIHTDLQLKNLLVPAPEDSALLKFEEKEFETPSPRKVSGDRTIYTSPFFPPSNGIPLLSDFGEARFADEKVHTDDIMPNPYRAPEVILKESWDYKVDIWNVAMVAWDIVCSHTLIYGKNSDGIFDDRVHVADSAQRCKLSSVFWDENGNWKDLAPIPEVTLEGLAADVDGEDKEGFLRWLRMALRWNPEERPSALDSCMTIG
ncbi:U4/U6 small nuclear ribonucleo protein PRP4 [Aspergillus avenaceus]|uniref:non-specific serine/threonine protein kinase n=1 Tax=Aspergillus avenaceus TaxID=36643 RepID=A0A5N6U193_ASPAV|nr:U4/U6 small nuclear ribonucleo protein PRP4 [Aspergillus avenaceus]